MTASGRVVRVASRRVASEFQLARVSSKRRRARMAARSRARGRAAQSTLVLSAIRLAASDEPRAAVRYTVLALLRVGKRRRNRRSHGRGENEGGRERGGAKEERRHARTPARSFARARARAQRVETQEGENPTRCREGWRTAVAAVWR